MPVASPPGLDDFSTLFDFLPIGAYRNLPDGQQVRANAALVAFNGFASEAEQLAAANTPMVAAQWYLQPQRRAEFRAILQADGFVKGFISEVQRHRGKEHRWVCENAHLVRDAHGMPRYYEGTVEDITERMQAVAALERSEAELREIAKNLPGMIVRGADRADGQRRFTFVSDGVQELYGIGAAEAMADPLLLRGFIHPDDQASFVAESNATIAARTRHFAQFRIIAADGRLKWIEMVASGARDGASELRVRYAVMLDITQRKAAEAALRESEERWKLALDSSGDGVWDWDIARRVETYSPQLLAMYGLDGRDLTDLMLDERTHPDDRARKLADRDAHLHGITPRYINEHRVRCKDGSWKWVLSRGMVIVRDGNSRALRMIGTHTDITARKQAEALQLERDRAAASDRAKSELLSRVSHELRTPLNGVLGFAQLLDQAAELNPRHKAWLQQVLASGQHLLSLVDDVLDLSSAQSGEMSLAWAEVDPLAVAAESWSMLAAVAERAGVSLQDSAGAGDGLRVRADRKRLTQVMSNLLSNAIKYNRPGGSVTVRAQRSGLAVEISVSDNGLGMDATQLARIFTPFERLGAQHSPVEGTGLGLALARQLVLAMKGQIGVVSRAGEGTTFTLTLPAAE